MPQEPQQSELYEKFIRKLKWNAARIDGVRIFFRWFPFGQSLAKIHRPQTLPDTGKLRDLFERYRIKHVVIEPVADQNTEKLKHWMQSVSGFVHIVRSPYLPTKTIHIPLKDTPEAVFNRFSEAKRRAVRRALKLGVVIRQSDSITDLIRIKNRSSGMFGFITTHGISQLWSVFAPDHASILLAYDPSDKLIAGVLLLHWDGVTYYWIAGGTKYGKKLFAPTLLVWESLQIAVRKKSAVFDFVGVWDERLPKDNLEWKGFTKFKQGFGGTDIYYPLAR